MLAKRLKKNCPNQVMVLKNLIGRHEAFEDQEGDSIYS